MSVATALAEFEVEVIPHPLILDFKPLLKKIDDDDFFQFCRANDFFRIEQTKEGDVIIMMPTGGETGGQNFDLTASFAVWVRMDRTGKGFDSSTVFVLPNGAKRSPDVAWVKLDRWDALTAKERKKFPPLCPDFVIELRSPTDALKTIKAKMEEYIENGAQLGWLIDPIEKKVYIYRPNAPVECLDNPANVSGEPLLKGFVLEMSEVWG